MCASKDIDEIEDVNDLGKANNFTLTIPEKDIYSWIKNRYQSMHSLQLKSFSNIHARYEPRRV